jgi:hypothetical protein
MPAAENSPYTEAAGTKKVCSGMIYVAVRNKCFIIYMQIVPS